MEKKSFAIKKRKLIFDSIIFCISLAGAWFLLKSEYFHSVILSLTGIKFLAEILAGALYTSFATSPLAVAAIIVLSEESNPIIVGLLGGLGAVMVDLLIIKFFRGSAKSDLSTLSRILQIDGVGKILKRMHLEIFVVLLGSIIIASPLPDELGLLLLGQSNLSFKQLTVLSYLLNTAGIMTIAITANLLS